MGQTSVKTWQLLLLMVLLPVAGWMAGHAWDQSYRILTAKNLIDQAWVCYQKGEVRTSINLLEQALALDPYQYQAYRDLSGSYFKLTHQRRISIMVCDRAMQFIPNDGRLQEDLGRLHYLAGDFDLAVEHLQMAQKLLGPDSHEDELLDMARHHAPVGGQTWSSN
ncbi:MAG TPA: tetratricopeptide repeat protein [Candidatus Xenobia bacterium]|jgi:tetratricopeptide (TPR) repeat protein